MAFYKIDNEQLLEAQNFVSAPTFELWATKNNEYKYPFNGWYWFDNIELAKQFFNLNLQEITYL